jgi:hypothetical protein
MVLSFPPNSPNPDGLSPLFPKVGEANPDLGAGDSGIFIEETLGVDGTGDVFTGDIGLF